MPKVNRETIIITHTEIPTRSLLLISASLKIKNALIFYLN